MTALQGSTIGQPRHCKICGTGIGKGKQLCEPCRMELRREHDRIYYQKERAARPERPKTIQCLQCGKERTTQSSIGYHLVKFCSDACRIIHWKSNGENEEKIRLQEQRRKEKWADNYSPRTTIHFKVCSCGNRFIARNTIKKLCNECRRKEGIKNSIARVARITRTDRRTCKCRGCGVSFSRLYGQKARVCSDECKVEARKKSMRENRNHYKHNRRVRIRDTSKSAGRQGRFKRIDIFNRDKWKCKLCGKKVDKRLEHNDLMSATIDHIIPISLGGRHCAENVQLAHRICNSKKSYTGKGDQLLLFG